VQLKKTIAMINGENTVVVMYNVLKAANPFTLELLSLLAVRDYHGLAHANEAINPSAAFNNGIFTVTAYPGTPEIFIKVPGAGYAANPCWFYHFNYSVEQERGLDFKEDLFSHGKFTLNLKEGDTLGIIVSDKDPDQYDARQLLAGETARRQALLAAQPKDEMVQQLVLAADQFIVKKGAELKTVIAGYHWFADWGRDTMIALPGLCLSTGRFDDARKILAAFAAVESMGMLPNRFGGEGDLPEYNNADGTLWFFIAVYKYLQASRDTDFVLQQMLPVLSNIIDWHYKGTRYHIHVAESGLLYAGEQGQQLTWMDAKVGDWVVTPRMGKPVELQALWYNALKIFSALLSEAGRTTESLIINDKAEKMSTVFLEQFWNTGSGYLYDVIDENGMPDASLRPNQLLAISLPFALVQGEQAAAVLKITEEKLYTPVGLRTLPEDDSRFVPVYNGDAYCRDAAYHQGTVWGWLLGPYIDAIMAVSEYRGIDGLAGKEKALKIIADCSHHLQQGCIGTVAEIFDGEAPHHPRGCVAQAWSVSELLRVIKEYGLYR
jgi:predicted glycogen debranching enzyme